MSDLGWSQINDQIKSTYEFDFLCEHEAITCDDFINELIGDALKGLNLQEQKIL